MKFDTESWMQKSKDGFKDKPLNYRILHNLAGKFPLLAIAWIYSISLVIQVCMWLFHSLAASALHTLQTQPFCLGGLLCAARMGVRHAHYMPVACCPHLQLRTSKTISRHCQMSPRKGKCKITPSWELRKNIYVLFSCLGNKNLHLIYSL